MKKFTVVCDFQGGQKSPFDFYIGAPEPTHHPIHCQAAWLSSSRGGTPPADIMESLQKLYNLATENNMDFEELCFYAMSNATQDKEDNNVKDSTEEEEQPEDEEENSKEDNAEESN